MIDIIEVLQDHGMRVVAEDCWADDEVLSGFPSVTLEDVTESQGMDALIFAVPHKFHANLPLPQIVNITHGQSVITDVRAVLIPQCVQESKTPRREVWQL